MPKLHVLHPSTAFFGLPREWGTFTEDVKRWGRMIRGQLGPDLENAKPNGTAQDFAHLMRLGLAGEALAVDIETAPAARDRPWTGKDPTQARMKTIAIGTTAFGVSVYWPTIDAATKQQIYEILKHPNILKVFHNGPWFDIRVLAREGMPVANWEDTRDLRRAHSSTSRLSLRYLGSLYSDISNWKDDETEEAGDGKFWDSDDLDTLQVYNAKDTIVTARVWEALRKEHYDERVAKLYETHKRLSELTARMHSRGIFVRDENRRFLAHCLEQSLVEKRDELRRATGMEDFPCTDAAMRALIYKRHKKDGIKCFGLPDPYDKNMWTNEHKGTISVDENSLIALLVGGMCPPDLVPIVEAWWVFQGEKKRLGYVKSALLDQATGPDGRLRPGWNSCGTDTGRFSCSAPNVMNMEQLLRAILGPADGHAMVHADKKQLEIRVMEAVAADNVLYDAINSGDLYTAEARDYFNIEASQPVKGGARKSAKIIRLARQYGAGLSTCYGQALRMDRTFTLSRTKLLMTKFDKRYYRTVEYWHEEMAKVRERGFSETLLSGRRRTYPYPPELSEVVNYPVQGTAADIMNEEILLLDERLTKECPSAFINVQLHDAIDVECPEKDVPQVERIVDAVMDREVLVNGRLRRFGIDRKTTYASQGGSWADV